MEQQAESPYKWYMDSRYNKHFGGTYYHASDIDTYVQYDDLLVPEGGDNVIQDIGIDSHSIKFVVIKNTGNSDIIMKYTDAGGSSTSGYKWYIGVNEIWATSIVGGWTKLYAYGVSGNSRISLFAGKKLEGGG